MASPTIQAAVDNLVATIREKLLEEFLGLIGGSNGAPKTRRSAGAARAPRALTPKRMPKGGKRTPQQIVQLTSTVLAYIRKNPGHRVEQIAAGLSTRTRDLALPIFKLHAAKMLKTQGVRRGTTYTAK